MSEAAGVSGAMPPLVCRQKMAVLERKWPVLECSRGGHDVENLANLALVHEIEHCAT